MNDQAAVRIIQSLDLDYSKAILSTKHFEQSIESLNKQLLGMKGIAIQTARDVGSSFSNTLGTSVGSKSIVDQYGNAFKTVQMEATKLSKSTTGGFTSATIAAKDHAKSVKDVAKEYSIMDSQFQRRTSWFLTGGLIFGSLKGAKEAIQTISEVEMGMVEIARVMEDSTFVFENYRDELLQLGVDYGQSFETVQQIALRWAQSGYNVADSLELAKTSLLALNTAELDAATATESMIGIMAQWNLQAEDLALVMDKINLTADNYSVTSDDLVNGLLRSSGAARIMNLSLDETISLLTIMREASGRTGQEVGNALNSILSYIQRPSSINALESMGIGMFADSAKTQFRNVMDIFKDIASQWKTSSDVIKDGFVQSADEAGLFNEELATALGLQEEWNDVQKRDIAQASAGVYRRNYFIGMIERLSNAQGVLNGMMDANGYSMRENERTMDTLEKKYQSLKTSAEQLAVALGDAGLLDLLKDIVDAGTDVTSAIAGVDDEMKALLTTALELIAVMASIKAISGLFTAKNIFTSSVVGGMQVGALLPGWTKLLVIIPTVLAGLQLYVNNLDKSADATEGLKDKQTALIKTYEDNKTAAKEAEKSLLEQANSTETLAKKLEELNSKENLNSIEKAQLKDIAERLNTTFADLGLKIDANTGKIIGNTNAIYGNITALKEQALAQGYQATMQATANSIVEEQLTLAQIRTKISEKEAELATLTGGNTQAYINAQSEIEGLKDKYSIGTRPYQLKRQKILKEYGITDANIQISKIYGAIGQLQSLENEADKKLNELNTEFAELEKLGLRLFPDSSSSYDEALREKFASKNRKLLGGDTGGNAGAGDTGGGGGTSSGSYRNTALENALKVLDYQRYINEKTLEEEIERLYEIRAEYVETADELMDINKRIYSAEQELLDEKKNSYKLEENNIQHLAQLGVYSVEQQIEAYKELYSIKAESLADEQNRVENLFNLYKQLLSEEQKKIKDAYDERIDLIDEEAKRKKENLEDEKKSIQEQMDLLDRKDNERSYEQTMTGLQEDLKYWQVRTSEEARKKVIEIQEQIDEEKYKHELEKEKESLQDKIDVLDDEIDEVERTADEEKKKWEKSYKQIEKAFDTHSTNIVALAGAMSKEAYQEWVNNYLTPLSSALSSGNFDMFDNLTGGLDGSIDGLKPSYSGRNYVLVNRDGTSNAKAGDIVVTGGGLYKKNADGTSTKVGDLSGGSTNDYNKVVEEYNKLIPKFHNGGKLLTDGLIIGKKQEMVLTPDLSLRMDSLLSFLRGNTTFNKNSTSTAYDNRKEVKIGNLVNIENNHMEDEVDSNMFARELSRQLANL